MGTDTAHPTTLVVPRRPRVTRDMIATAAQGIATANKWDASLADEIAETFEIGMDGYELAKALETRHCWDITVHDVEALDQMDSEVDDLLRKAGIAWAQEHNIQPPLPVGTVITRGEITGICEPAMYYVRENGETSEHRRLLVRFEHAQPVAEVVTEGGAT